MSTAAPVKPAATTLSTRAALSISASRARLAKIIAKRSFGRGEITLASGRKSDFYFNLKPTMLDPEGAALLAELTYDALKDEQLDYIGGLEMGAVPLAGAMAQLSWLKGHPIAAFFVRKQAEGTWRKTAGRRPRQGRDAARQACRRGRGCDHHRRFGDQGGGTRCGRPAATSCSPSPWSIVRKARTRTFKAAGVPFRALYKASEFLKG